jgi:hypothetical protein
LKRLRCPHCVGSGTLNRHSRLRGKGFGSRCERVPRGQRVFCSNRGRRGGCGRTFSIYLCATLPRHGVDALMLSRLFAGLLAGLSLKAAVEPLRSAFALETFYHLRARLRLRLEAIRTLLCRQTGPPACASADPLLHTLAHLRAACASVLPAARRDDCPCMCSCFQMRFQRPFLG